MAQLLEWVRDGQLQPHISHEIEAARVREAFTVVLDRKVTGKVVVTFPPASGTGVRLSRL